eukprot:72914-Chlamydomonas_euryale.AAC.2
MGGHGPTHGWAWPHTWVGMAPHGWAWSQIVAHGRLGLRGANTALVDLAWARKSVHGFYPTL